MNILDRFRIQTYNIGIIKKPINDVLSNGIDSNSITWLKHTYKDRFFADPFMIDETEQYYYILCEEYLFFEEKGKITLLIVNKDDFSLFKRKVVIEEETHLSFPYCKYKGNEIIPESSESGKLYSYTIDRNSYCILKKEEMLAEGAIDAVIYKDYLYATKHPNPLTKSFCYKMDDAGRGFILPGKEIINNDKSHSRAAGDFFEINNHVYRAVQDCEGRYGRQTKIVEVEKLGEEYCAKDVITVNSFKNPPYSQTLHTFNVYKDCIIVDGSFDFLYFPQKIFYKKMKFLFRNRVKKG